MTKRFDRNGTKKVHTQTLAAICPGADSYEQLIAVCRKLHLPETDCQEVFRRMVFNILANNTDDHNKNFSFIMNEDGLWHLAPAYDITYIINRGGFLPNEEHCMFIRAKLRGITRKDVIEFARDNGIRRPDTIIRDVVASLEKFRQVALKYGVKKEWIGRVETCIDKHLRDWGESNDCQPLPSIEINGHIVKNIRIEETYKGNYHLYADIDNVERKFVIAKNKKDFSRIKNTGVTNIPTCELVKMTKTYFKL